MESKIAVLYGPEGGNTDKVAQLIKAKLGESCELILVNQATKKTIEQYQNFIFGISTIGTHTWKNTTNSDWDSFIPKFRDIDLKGKTFAMYGLGDQVAYANHFVDDLIIAYKMIVEQGGKHIGMWPTEGYDFNDSESTIDDKFVGLAIDEDHQSELTNDRVSNWVDQIAPLFK